MVSGLGLSCSDTSVAVETAAAPVVVIPLGLLPPANGEPLTVVNAPLVPSIASATTVLGLSATSNEPARGIHRQMLRIRARHKR